MIHYQGISKYNLLPQDYLLKPTGNPHYVLKYDKVISVGSVK